ncbi:MAG: PAS domain S-box protein [Proteobacteria bacterium]|nr:PAS domain S-box protein [Pseudomonadota bacterium]MBU1452042.1 PAS domain S-box protein [Pseudomonadota bacterium]MBU2467749.1 PAS domain S-box protein [Pseudomonadota bacterium]
MTDELTEAKARLARSREKFHTLTMALARTLGEGIVLCAMDGKVVQANQAYQDMLGYSLKELRKKTYQELTPAKWRDLEDKLREEQIMKRGWCEVYEKEYVRKDGGVFPVRTQAWLVRDEGGRPLYLLGIFRDISGEAGL